MSNFTTEEAEFMHSHGNKVAKRSWLATWSPETCPAPDAADVKRLKDFMRRKYVVKECVAVVPLRPMFAIVEFSHSMMTVFQVVSSL
jgi:Putative GTPase activating protein for Arf